MKRLAVLLVIIASVSALPARAQDDNVGLVVSPFHVEQDLSSRDHEQVLTYRNDEDVRLSVRLRVRRLAHDMDGAPRHLRSAQHEEAFRLSRSSFELEPGASTRVRLEGAIPGGETSMYLGVVAEFDRGTTAGSSVAVRSRVVSQFLLRAPKPWRERLDVTDVGIAPGQGGSVTVYAIARNVGNVHVRPRGEIEIRQGGRVLDTVRLGRPLGAQPETPPAIIPSFSRRLVGTWDPPVGLSGRIRLIARLRDPRATGTGRATLGPDAQAPPAVSIATLRADPRTGGIVTVQLSNDGADPVRDVAVTLVAREGENERARIVLPGRHLQPGLAPPQTWEPDLADGTYVITATAAKGETTLDEKVVDLAIGTGDAGPGDGTSSRIPLIVAGALLLLVLVLFLILVLRKRRRDAATRTAAR